MKITRTIEQARAAAQEMAPISLVPTMGALHDGHLSLVRVARQQRTSVAVSIFVNPTQFGAGEDLSRYPRPVDRDLEHCRNAGVDLVFIPGVEQMYPPHELEAVIDIPSLTGTLEGAHRPGHFIGVCRVVAKLLNIIQPRTACFGMKDYQQLCVIQAMVAAMGFPVNILACPTVREPDGLAMSSRNVYLDPQQRRHAVGLIKALRDAEGLIRSGESDVASVESTMRQVIHAHHIDADYAVVRNARTLAPIDLIHPELQPVVCLVAGRLGEVRLIDNTVISADTINGKTGS